MLTATWHMVGPSQRGLGGRSAAVGCGVGLLLMLVYYGVQPCNSSALWHVVVGRTGGYGSGCGAEVLRLAATRS